MYYFLKKENFNLDIYDFDIDILPRFTKSEQKIFKFLLELLNKENEYTEIVYENKLLKISFEKFKETINNILKKTINMCIFKDSLEITSFSFNIFDIVVFEDKKIIYKFSREIILAQEYGNIYNRLFLIAILMFENKYSYNFLKILLKNLRAEKEITLEFTLDEFRHILGVPHNKYTRFYDLETKILNPIIKDLEVSETYIQFIKIKSNKRKGSKITGIKIFTTNSFYMEINRDTNILLKEYASKVEDFSIAYKNIYSYRKTHNLDETTEFINKNIELIFNKMI